MHRFVGVVALDQADLGSDIEARLRSALGARRSSRVNCRRFSNAVFAEALPQKGTSPPRSGLAATDIGLVAIDSRLDNHDELASALELSPGALRETGEKGLFARCFERWGAAGIARALGAFAFVHWDPNRRRLTLARDCMGLRTLFFHRGDGRVSFANTLPGLLALPWVPREIDERGVAEFLALNATLSDRTYYAGIERVPSRTMVTIDPEAITRERYWDPSFAPPPFRRTQDYVERARELFDRAVMRATSDLDRIAIATSGGLDSSAIAVTAARLGRSVACYTMLPPVDYAVPTGPNRYLSERSKVEALGRMHPQLELRFFAPQGEEDFDGDDLRFFARLAQPSRGPLHQAWYGAMERGAVADGHRVLLTGTHGNFTLTWDGRFALSSLFRRGAWRLLAHELNATARENKETLLRTAYAEVLKPLLPASLHRLAHRLRGRDPDSVARFSALNPDYIAEHRLGVSWREAGFDPWFGQLGRNPQEFRAFRIFDRAQGSRDYMAMYEAACGLEMRDPYADRELIEFCLAVPEWLYRVDGVPRAFARTVFADRLPPEILHERRRGLQGGAWFHRMNRAQLAGDVERLEASATVRRLIDLPRVKRLLDDWPKDERTAEARKHEFYALLSRTVHVGRFIRWVEGGNA